VSRPGGRTQEEKSSVVREKRKVQGLPKTPSKRVYDDITAAPTEYASDGAKGENKKMRKQGDRKKGRGAWDNLREVGFPLRLVTQQVRREVPGKSAGRKDRLKGGTVWEEKRQFKGSARRMRSKKK